MINWKVRFKNPVFLAQLALSVMTPVLAYAGLTLADLTSWSALGQVFVDAIMNPYVLGLVTVSVWNALNDPTRAGVKDSEQAMTYDTPKGGE
jgi:phi LC3 family holin